MTARDSSSILFRSASCACGGGCQACQAKSNDLKVSQSNDPAEVEADAIADKVIRMPAGETAGKEKRIECMT